MKNQGDFSFNTKHLLIDCGNIHLMLLNNDDLCEKEKVNMIIKLLSCPNKYYYYSYLINKDLKLLEDNFLSIEYFLSHIINSKKLKSSYKLKLASELISNKLVDDNEQVLKKLKRVLK